MLKPQPVNTTSPELEALEIGIDEPQFAPLQGDEEATPEEEMALGKAMEAVMTFLYSEKGMASVVNVLNQENRELYEAVPEIGAMLIQKAQADLADQGIEIPSSVYFGEGGLLQQIPPMLFELAEQMGKPGAEDDDQLSAALIGLYKKAGEHVLQSKDEASINEAKSMGADVVLTDDEGNLQDPEKYSRNMQKKAAKEGKQDLRASISRGLLEL